MPRARPGPEQQARARIDAQLADAGWVVQDREAANLAAADGVVEIADDLRSALEQIEDVLADLQQTPALRARDQ